MAAPLRRVAAAALLALPCLTACSAAGSTSVPAVERALRERSPIVTPIRHLVIVVQENRSFVNLFSGFPGADAPVTGTLPGGAKVPLEAVPFNTVDVEHSYEEAEADVDGGKMDGFAGNYAYDGGGGRVGRIALSYLKRTLVAPYWSMASQYTLADRMFPTEPGPSWTSHIDLIAGTTNVAPHAAVIDFPDEQPYGCGAPSGTATRVLTLGGVATGPYPCFTQFRTLADTLDAARVSWRYYAPAIVGDPSCSSCGFTWSAFSAISAVRNGRDWRNVVSPSPQILKDVAAGRLAGVTWVVPDEAYSDHADLSAKPLGPSWVAAVVNAIGESKFWQSTAIVVVWDEWGGFYDDVVPPNVAFNGLGIRVGCIVISPYAKRHYVSHTQYEFGSVLKFAEQVFNLPPLGATAAGYSDRRANSLIDAFDFAQTPPPFKPIAAPYPPSTFLQMRPSRRPPDSE